MLPQHRVLRIEIERQADRFGQFDAFVQQARRRSDHAAQTIALRIGTVEHHRVEVPW